MSCITSVTLTTSSLDGENARRLFQFIADADADNDWCVRPVPEDITVHAAGAKEMQFNVYCVAYNYLDMDDFVPHFETWDWRMPMSAVLIISTEWDGPHVYRARVMGHVVRKVPIATKDTLPAILEACRSGEGEKHVGAAPRPDGHP